MANGNDAVCPQCGQPLDVIINADGSREYGGCTNPDCPGNVVASGD
jgi:ssDNA-binding Zn-finger/Zn-ribbon topoisomerase 1